MLIAILIAALVPCGIVSDSSFWPFALTLMGPFSFLAFTFGVPGWVSGGESFLPTLAWTLAIAAPIVALMLAPVIRNVRAAWWLCYIGFTIWLTAGVAVWTINV